MKRYFFNIFFLSFFCVSALWSNTDKDLVSIYDQIEIISFSYEFTSPSPSISFKDSIQILLNKSNVILSKEDKAVLNFYINFSQFKINHDFELAHKELIKALSIIDKNNLKSSSSVYIIYELAMLNIQINNSSITDF